MSQKIITLSPELANQIAAGEVVERPASVVKELLENSIDAGATHVDIDIVDGGKTSIEIRDNGAGIAPEDIPKTIEKYSTSKIKDLKDLQEVMTFGFRGEALASIASVSRFTLTSRETDGGEPMRLTYENGEMSITPAAHDIGTTIRVEDLFYNTPARLNYLKTDRTEFLKIQNVVEAIALSYPDIWFRLTHNAKPVAHFPKEEGIQARIEHIYGAEFSQNMIPVSHEFWGVEIQGYITDPKISFGNKSRQTIFLNHRSISSPIISKALFDGYQRYIPHGRHPGYIIHVRLDPTQVDVNVHPRKLEVRFAQEQTLFRSVYHSVHDTLERVSLTKNPTSWTEQNVSTQTVPTVSPISQQSPTPAKTPHYHTGSGATFHHYSPYKDTTPNPAQTRIEVSHTNNTSDSGEIGNLRDTPLGTIVWQLHNSYIVVETPQGIQILDQHALAERIIYERLAKESYTPKSQQLLWGVGVHLTSRELETLEQYQEIFQDMGFEIDMLSAGNILVQSIPDFVASENLASLISQILSDISTLGKSTALDEVRHKLWAYTACRSAVKFWDKLSLFEMQALLRDATLSYSATCPHGRPVVYDIWLEELQKKYER